jgi:hypothetical protein
VLAAGQAVIFSLHDARSERNVATFPMLTLVVVIVSCLLIAGGALVMIRQRRDPARGLANLGAVSTQWLQGHREEP